MTEPILAHLIAGPLAGCVLFTTPSTATIEAVAQDPDGQIHVIHYDRLYDHPGDYLFRWPGRPATDRANELAGSWRGLGRFLHRHRIATLRDAAIRADDVARSFTRIRPTETPEI